MEQQRYIVWLESLRMSDVAKVGGKNASLGEMISQLAHLGVRVPGGFATTAAAYRDFLAQSGLDKRIRVVLEDLAVTDVTALAVVGSRIRQWIVDTSLPPRLESEVREAYGKMQAEAGVDISWAIRSSATAEDLPDASFAGQQETFLNINGVDHVLSAIKQVFASLYNDRAIAYRVHQGFKHQDVALSAGVQRMVRSDLGASGVMFTLDTESGFEQVVLINSAYGLGETVVQGAVNPDEFYVYKPALKQGKAAVISRNLGGKAIKMIFGAGLETGRSVLTVEVPPAERQHFSITDAEVEELARYGLIIEQHYGRAMDIEWGKDGLDGKLYILQARPETVQSHETQGKLRRYRLKQQSQILVSGRAVGQRIGSGPVCLVADASKMNQVQPGDVLVTDMTDPDWEPVMKRASAIVTNRGGRTCHAAIVARELGIPAVVGCSDATQILKHGDAVTVSCAEGDVGKVYQGMLDIEMSDLALDEMPTPPIKISLNVANPELAFESSRLPNAGVGLARLEFIIARMIGVHPKVVLAYPNLSAELKVQVEAKTAGYATPVDFYVEKLAEGIAMLGAAFAPKPVIVRFSDFKSNEYSSLLGGSQYEPNEENPMIGLRGASRYIVDSFRDCFALECRAIRRVRDEIGLTNIEVMIPFVRTLDEAEMVIKELAKNGLRRGENGLRLIMMCEIPSNALLAEQFLEYFDGFSIGSNDLTQLTLGIDRESGLIAGAFDERNPAVKALLSMAIQACRKANKYIGICGQGPSDHPDLAQWLVEQGIEAVSLNPDTVVETWLYLAEQAAKK
ncbi:phosphoenolpyruvate synthase [Candidatus Nitrotoga sp. 1052]|uniref:phosphoenolpyruvate synthase n=1 Tax=Candidatus Nitrotoga sp. 1052 TaxID=2886964 RepID=UPI001EF5B3E0|nr:phosphoenolpyruvate synthase [Candidatus Nitrotoga sp. 1052]CAH1074697.1 phosphoenolpyruvate synthetase [Candidatus Nitrotoga sp. 1052]